LRELAGAICAALQQATVADDQRVELLNEHVTATCQGCGRTLSGLDWLRVSAVKTPATVGDESLDRLVHGYCGNRHCDASYYRVTLTPHPSVVWPTDIPLAASQPVAATLDSSVVERLAVHRAEKWRQRRRGLARLGVLVFLLGLVLLLQRWRAGGRIPIIREPRQFHASPSLQAGLGDTKNPVQRTFAAPGNATQAKPKDPELPDLSLIKPDEPARRIK
jgi:hypothetical protein